jgi:hypothetical protein
MILAGGHLKMLGGRGILSSYAPSMHDKGSMARYGLVIPPMSSTTDRTLSAQQRFSIADQLCHNGFTVSSTCTGTFG